MSKIKVVSVQKYVDSNNSKHDTLEQACHAEASIKFQQDLIKFDTNNSYLNISSVILTLLKDKPDLFRNYFDDFDNLYFNTRENEN